MAAAAGPQIAYAKSRGLSIAYSVAGEGPLDLVVVPGFVSHLEGAFGQPLIARSMQRFASFSRLTVFDKPGTGRDTHSPTAFIADLGAASGHLVIAACEAWPQLQGIVFDMEKIISMAREFVDQVTPSGFSSCAILRARAGSAVKVSSSKNSSFILGNLERIAATSS